MTLLVGLGNPGAEYAQHRHNAGFHVIDRLLTTLRPIPANKSAFKGELFKTHDLLLLKPSTYMNLSGESVRAVMDYFKPQRLVVAHDEIELPPGALRIKFAGGHAGHNGLRSIDQHCTPEYFRVRVGIGKPADKARVADWCLSNFNTDDLAAITPTLALAADAMMALASGEALNQVTARFTQSPKPPKESP